MPTSKLGGYQMPVTLMGVKADVGVATIYNETVVKCADGKLRWQYDVMLPDGRRFLCFQGKQQIGKYSFYIPRESEV